MNKYLNIIYCEDSDEMRNFMGEAIREFFSSAVNLFEFKNSKEAIYFLSNPYNPPIDFVISDLNMEKNKEDGLELYRYLEKRSITIPFYLFTTSMAANLENYLMRDNFFYFQKGDDIESILLEMEKIYENSKSNNFLPFYALHSQRN